FNLAFTCPDKGCFALMGPSGCGKTTLLHLLSGLSKPDSGAITSTHGQIAMSFQEPRLLPWLNCEDNIKLVLSKRQDAAEMTAKWLAAFELSDAARQLPGELSGGMKQRLSLARALAYGGDLFLFDEPFSALDPELKSRIAPIIKEATKHALVILVTHDPEDAELLDATILECNGSPLSMLK
ncbi:MAG: ATP-binding cassette domain-containing protein, partial [Clostridia bacterium]|nr:ATP-binding cassette domain-containing protein [Clostridia bacterium]